MCVLLESVHKKQGSPNWAALLSCVIQLSDFPLSGDQGLTTSPGLTAALALDQALSKAAQSRTGRIDCQIS